MYDLIRFFQTKEEAEEFMHGTIRMNTMDFFFNHGLQDPKVSYEGAVSPDNILIGDKKRSEILSELGIEHVTTEEDERRMAEKRAEEVQYRHDAIRYCNVLSMMKHGYDRKNWTVEKIPEEMLQFGNYAIIISNVEVFVNHLFEALKAQKDAFGIMGPVVYHDRIKKNIDLDLFDRSDAFEWQKEWRLCMIKQRPGFDKILEQHPDLEYEIPITLQIDDMYAYSEVVDAKMLVKHITSIYKGFRMVDKIEVDMQSRLLQRNGFPVPYDTYCEQYVGYTPRPAFLGKVLETDRAKVREL